MGVRIPVRAQSHRMGTGRVAELRRQAAVSVLSDRAGHRYSPRRASTRWPARYSPIPIPTRIRGSLSRSSKCCAPASIHLRISARRSSPMRTTRLSLAVADGVAQGGAVDGYVWETLALRAPELTRRTAGRACFRRIRVSADGCAPLARPRDVRSSFATRCLRCPSDARGRRTAAATQSRRIPAAR